MKTIYTVVIYLVFGGVDRVIPYEDKAEMEEFILEWVNANAPEGISFSDVDEGIEWFEQNSDQVEEGIMYDSFTLDASPLPTAPMTLKERIRPIAEEMAVAMYTGDENATTYEDAMEVQDIWDVTTVWEPFARRSTDEVKELITNEADRLEGFAHSIVSMMNVEEMMNLIALRAQSEGVVESVGNVCLLTIKSMNDFEKDDCERSGWGVKNDQVIVDTEEYRGNSEYIHQAKAFGVAYVHGI